MLERIKAEIGSLMFSAQYQQRPVPLEGNLVKRDWFRFYDLPPQPGPGDLVVQSWDIAMMTGRGSNTPTFGARSQALSRGTVPKLS